VSCGCYRGEVTAGELEEAGAGRENRDLFEKPDREDAGGCILPGDSRVRARLERGQSSGSIPEAAVGKEEMRPFGASPLGTSVASPTEWIPSSQNADTALMQERPHARLQPVQRQSETRRSKGSALAATRINRESDWGPLSLMSTTLPQVHDLLMLASFRATQPTPH
jgi:hypothetical protein